MNEFVDMEEWKEYKLGDVCSRLKSGKGIKSNLIYDKGLYPVIGGNGLRGYTDKSNFQGECGIIGRQGAYCGNVRYFEGESYMTEHAIVVVGNDYADTYYLTSLLSLMHLGNLSAQSAQPGISVQTLSKQIVNLPSVIYQKKVSKILKSLDDKIEVNRRINEQLEELAQALFKSWFVDFEPFKDGAFVESELGMIPEGWKVGTLGDILYISKESINPAKMPNCIFHHYSIPAYDNGKRDEIQEGHTILSNKFKVNNKTTLFSKLNPRIKRVWFLDEIEENSICSTEFVPYKAKDEELVYFVNSILCSDYFYNKTMSIVNGATGSHQRFHPKDTLNFIFAYDMEVAKKYNNIIKPIITKILNNQQEIHHLTTLRDTLLPKLMSGEIDVSEVEV